MLLQRGAIMLNGAGSPITHTRPFPPRGRRRQRLQNRSARRPAPAVRRLLHDVSGAGCRGQQLLIAVTQRDDTLLLAPEQARTLAQALLQAADTGAV
jgi:hypothetical protein